MGGGDAYQQAVRMIRRNDGRKKAGGPSGHRMRMNLLTRFGCCGMEGKWIWLRRRAGPGLPPATPLQKRAGGPGTSQPASTGPCARMQSSPAPALTRPNPPHPPKLRLNRQAPASVLGIQACRPPPDLLVHHSQPVEPVDDPQSTLRSRRKPSR
jgi:hypothetical protein